MAAALLMAMAAVGVASAEGARVGSEAEVIADGGANLRQAPGLDAPVVTLVGQARYVFVRAGPEDGWYRVEYDGTVGWLHGDLLVPARGRTTSRGDAVGRGAEERPPAGAPAGVRVGAEARVAAADGLNLRREPSTAAPVVELVRRARIVYVRAGPKETDEGLWYEVDYDGSIGWVMGQFLDPDGRGVASTAPKPEAPKPEAPKPEVAPKPAPAAKPAPAMPEAARPEPAPPKPEAVPARSEAPTPPAAPAKLEPAPAKAEAPAPKAKAQAAPARATPPAASRGEAIAKQALALVGSRYAWGGSSPRTGFDCSGLIAYVMGQFGIHPGRTAAAQAGAGVSVTGGSLQPGDIVVFANTYAGGYSHTGIYVGGGRFVHAEDYGTGVVVSSVFGGYWGRHYAGARRAW
jgi:cell wall-associated NlpC family hydrolase